jgi:DNA-binding transcriptional ArsR family regulator
LRDDKARNIMSCALPQNRRGNLGKELHREQKSLAYLIRVRYCLHVNEKTAPLDGNRLLAALAALANPHRLRIIAALSNGGRNYVSQLARDIGISRPLLHLHLQKLEEAGLVSSQLELSTDGKALNFFQVTSFELPLTPDAIAIAVDTLTNNPEK